jgi:membrane protease YdiL (CAAX protease family)
MQLSKYHITVIAIYAILSPIFLTFLPERLEYTLPARNLAAVIFTAVFSFLIFLLFFLKSKKNLNTRITNIFLAVIYAIIFAFPEEIIFRGIIQGFISQHTRHILLAILLSSLVFGSAHLWNGGNWNYRFASLAFLAGLPLGMLYALTGGLLVPTALHFAFVVVLKISD